MRRRLLVLGVLVSAATAACGTLLAAAEDDVPTTTKDGGGTGTDGAAADGSSTADGAAGDANDIDATLSTSDLYRASVMSDGPIAYWRFAEAPGAAIYADHSGKNHPANAGPGVQAPKIESPGIFGMPSHALVFNGDPSVRATSQLPFATGVFTIEAWLLLASALDGEYRHLSQHSNGSISYGIYVHAGEGIVIERIQNGQKDQVQLMNPTLNKWHHVVATRDSANDLHLYVDGVESTDKQNYGGTTPAGGGDFMLGAKGLNEPCLPDKTRVAEVAVYDKDLSAQRIGEHHRLGTLP